MSIDRRRGYIRATEHSDDVLKRWTLPSYVSNSMQPKETALNYDPSWESPELEDQVSELDLSLLTADALEQIRHLAYEEGMEEGRVSGLKKGRKAGFKKGKSEGFEEGKNEGFQHGLTDGQKLIETRCQHLDVIVDKLVFPLMQVDHQVQQKMLNIVIQLAKAVIQTEVKTNSEVILTTLREAVLALPMAERQISVYLHPKDLEVVTEVHSVKSLQDRQWKLVAAPSLNRGDIQVTCGDSMVDYCMEDRLKQLLNRFLGLNTSCEPEAPKNKLYSNVLRMEDISSMPDSEKLGPDLSQIDHTNSSKDETDELVQVTPMMEHTDLPVNNSSTVENIDDDDPIDEVKVHEGQPV
ncbi:flagellar assembly protein FliH [Candidatus Enterovibrio escicola]|uniref:flagellar assembly protein FliH n=1 Tax=Candidatus Enterovibrio escicola TaxID=1927127 RepID=UPI001237CD91|nr:flagellar assembly protein FliH [Candidatus Enterovibrio escacola]